MKLSLNTNIGSLTAQNQLLKANERLSTSFERLSSGLRINRASDDPAGLAMASGLQADSRLMAQALLSHRIGE
jgi:flagellin